ncbi:MULTISPECIES: ABC transporter ATP-binding protein [unclassified Caballeronia]|jgi:branched-chain amino acid transport system ATP-binding protein|uniref:ABC transporter ATP-binding protein n=1 Tax=unclassified Caballeronia TaxID=2646786 RepID=UPI002862014B|nr:MULTISPECIES: ABC transporter ATP-binding protein [unclassified Caballeronia]MDR5751056.1 ABC transporter ATP-binding protein [Caballeronia sp. LZ024]MDR5844809.1 ABC transporter ATP-binding protein [Caballeronia sp. LZ031]
MTAALELHRVTKRFGATEILRGVDLAIVRGERRALIGPNGAGKSTLFDLVSGRARASGGRIVVGGIDVSGMPAHRVARHGLARSFQTTSVFGGLCVFDNVRCALLGAPSSRAVDRWFRSRAIDRKAEAILESIGLTKRRDERAASLSYAEQRALDLGIALATDAPLLLLDEPTAGMNRAESARALDLIRSTTQGRTLLIVEHDMQAVFALADRISVLVRGEVIATGTPAEIRVNETVRAAYLGDDEAWR